METNEKWSEMYELLQNEANECLKKGDLAGYSEKMEAIGLLTEQMNKEETHKETIQKIRAEKNKAEAEAKKAESEAYSVDQDTIRKDENHERDKKYALLKGIGTGVKEIGTTVLKVAMPIWGAKQLMNIEQDGILPRNPFMFMMNNAKDI